MSWFQRKTAGIQTKRAEQNESPEGLWRKDPKTDEMVSLRTLEENHMVSESGHHFPLSGLGYCRMLFDDGAFTRFDDTLVSTDPLDFHDRKPYDARLQAAQQKTGLNDAAVAALGTVGGHKLSLAAMDFSFIGGSMGSVVGEIVARAIRRAVDERCALLIISQSGGARMMEGALSLMQMAKTSANLAVLAEQGLPYISLMTYPTTGGVTASFAMLGDFNVAEPGALIGFAGPRVIRETIGRDLPKGFQSSEFLLEQGFLDDIVPRPKLRESLIHMLDLLFEDAATDRQRPAPEPATADSTA
ncbi:MAG: acetyl-CoA carboxylase, carboxyltransferase subunit beta [Rhodothermales bacterium]